MIQVFKVLTTDLRLGPNGCGGWRKGGCTYGEKHRTIHQTADGTGWGFTLAEAFDAEIFAIVREIQPLTVHQQTVVIFTGSRRYTKGLIGWPRF